MDEALILNPKFDIVRAFWLGGVTVMASLIVRKYELLQLKQINRLRWNSLIVFTYLRVRSFHGCSVPLLITVVQCYLSNSGITDIS